MKNSTIAQRRAELSNNTVNNNTSNTMDNPKSVEIIVNLALSTNGATAGFFQKIDSENAKRGGCVLMRGRSMSVVKYKRDDNTVFAEFFPLPDKNLDGWNRNNNAVVIYHMEDGSSKILDAAQTEVFWADVFNLESANQIKDTFFKVTVDLPSHRADEASKMFRSNTARAISIKFDGIPKFSISDQPCKDGFLANLRPQNAEATYTRTTVGDDPQIISASNLSRALSVQSGAVAKLDVSKYSKSAKRRPARKAQAEAARASVEAAVQTPVVEDFDFNFGGSTVVSTAEETTTPVVETPVVDAEKEALRKENAELKAQVAELSANVANLTAMMQQFIASQAAPQPVAEPTPVVEEVTLEPVAEVEEAPAVEETVEEAPAPKLGSREWLAARRAKAAEAKARKSAGNSGFSAEDLLSFDA